MDIKSSLGFAARVRGKDDCALAPFLDMLNHSCGARVRERSTCHENVCCVERLVFGDAFALAPECG
jgi:hypothetical protein